MGSPLRDIRWARHALNSHEARAVAERLAGAPGLSASVLKRHGRSWVARLDLGTRSMLVKCSPINTLVHRVRTLTSGTRFSRHWDSAQWLKRHHVRTPEPLLLGTAHDGQGALEVLVLEFLPGCTLLECLADGLAPQAASHLARGLASQITGLTRHGRYNRDHKPSNLLVVDESVTGPSDSLLDDHAEAHVALIDCVGLRVPKKRDVWRGADRMLASMLIEPTGCGVRIRATDRLRMARALLTSIWRGDEPGDPEEIHGVHKRAWIHTSLRVLWRRVDQLVREHGDPTPAVNPLTGR